MSLETKNVLVTLQLIPFISNQTVYDPETWDQTEVKVWDSATKNDKVVAGLLGAWRAISEALKSHVGPQSETCALPDREGAAGSFSDPPATPSAPPLLQPTQAFAVMSPGDLNVPFDPGPMGPEKEPDLLPFDPGGIGYVGPEGRVD